MKKWFFSLSIFANVTLCAVVVVLILRDDQLSADVVRDIMTTSSIIDFKEEAPSESAYDPHALVRLAELEHHHLKPLEQTVIDPILDAAVTQQKLSIIRKTLLEEYGSSATDMPEFRRIFYPLRRLFPSFSSSKQIQLQELRLKKSIALRDANGPMEFSVIERNFSEEIKKILGQQDYAKFRLQDSPQTHLIRQAGLKLSQEDYLVLHDLLSDQANLFNVYNPKVRAHVGDENYFLLVKVMDPKYQLLGQLRDASGLSKEEFDDAYKTLAIAESEIVDAKQNHPLGTEASAANRIVNERNDSLVDRYGRRVATLLVTNFDNRSPIQFGARREARR